MREFQAAIVTILIFVMALGGVAQAKTENPALTVDGQNTQILSENKKFDKMNTEKLPEEIQKMVVGKETLAEKKRVYYNKVLEEHLLEKKRLEEEAKRKAEEEAKRKQVVAQCGYTPNFNEIYLKASQRYGVAWQIIAAIHIVETGQRGNTTVASYAGACGPMQFIPSTWAAYGQDGDGDGVANIYNVYDAIFGAANYLRANGGGQASIYRYNHSTEYVNRVLSIARGLGYQG